MADEKKCPDCGRRLVERKGKFGDFLGCSGFPQCKYTQNIGDYHDEGDYGGLAQDDDGHWR